MAEKIIKNVKIEVTDNGTLKRTSKDAQTLNRNMKGLSKQSSNSSKNFSKTAQGMQGVLVPAYAEVAARVFALTAVYQALSKASDFRILMQGQAEYAKRTGKNMAAISKSVQKAAKGMLDFAEASSAVALATTSGISSGQLIQMTKAAVDSSTALGRSVSDTMDRLTRGIVKAEPEILDEIGVIIRLDRVYKDYAESIKSTTANLSEAEKAHARYEAIVGQLETKFGGIADKVDPNYMRAAAASVLDVIMVASGSIVELLNPVLKFLSESKTAIVMILALIIKTLAGKVFPMFKGVGESIAAYPKKMGKNISDLTKRIKTMQTEIIKARNISATAGAAMDKANVVGLRGKAYKAGATSKLQQTTNLRSMRSTNVLMGKALGTKNSAIYKGIKITRKMYKKRIEDEIRLRSEIGKTHKTSEIYWKRSSVMATKFNLVMTKTKMLWGSAAKQAVHYFNSTKRMIADKGIIMGMVGGVKLLQRQWRMAGVQAGLYNKVLKGVTATTAVLGIVSAVTGAIVSKVFAWIMALTLIISLGKMILDMFVDFDTPFKRAADAATELNDQLKEQSTLLSQRDEIINFEGAANSFDEAMANVTFMDNFATSLYESTSTAMKALAVELGEMGFWEGLWDSMKGMISMGHTDVMEESIRRQIVMLETTSPGIIRDMEKSGDYGTDFGKKRVQKTNSGDINFNRKLINAMRDFRSEHGKDKSKSDFFASKEGRKYSEIKQLTLMDYFTSPEYLAAEDKGAKLLDFLKDLTAREKTLKMESRDTKMANDELTQSFVKLAKVRSKFDEGLLTKTKVYDLARQQEKIQKIFRDNKVTDAQKGIQAREAGFLDFKPQVALGGSPVDQMTGKMETFDQAAARAYMEQMGAGGFFKEFDWVEIEKTLMTSVTKRVKKERELANLQQFGNVALLEQSKLKEDIALLNIQAEKLMLESLQATNASEEDKAQAQEKYNKLVQDAVSLGAIHLQLAEHKAKIEGRTLTILERQDAQVQDIVARSGGPVDQMRGTKYIDPTGAQGTALRAEALTTAQTEGWKYLKSLDKTVAAEQKLKKLREELNALKEKDLELYKKIVAAQEKALKFSSYAGMDLSAERRAAILQDSDGVKLATSHRTLSKEIELKKEDRKYRKHKVLLDLEFKLEKIKDKNISEAEKLLQSKWAVEMELMKAQEAVRDAIWKDRAATFGAAMNKIAQSFGSAVGTYFNDRFMNKKPEEGAFRNTMAQGFAGAGSGMIAEAAQKQVFGNKGFVANMFRKIPGMGDEWVDTLFPKTELEMAKERTSYLKDIRDYFINGGGLVSDVMSSGLDGLNTAPGGNKMGGFKWGNILRLLLTGNMNVGASAMFPSGGWALANGGVVSGGFRAFANGGVANRPTLGMIGEGRYNEAVVPLPDGKSIPVVGAGGNNNVTVNVAIDSDGKSKAEVDGGGNAKELGYLVSQAVQSELVEQQRPGGLLSAY